MRPPLIAGLEGAVGTSTVAAALHGRDGGRCERGADVVVCGARPESLRLAGALEFPPSGPRPVLAVALVPGTAAPSMSRLRALDARFGALVLIPYVDTWHGPHAALDEASSVLGHPTEHLPRSLRSYAAAMRAIAAAVLRTGQLHRPTPPAARPRTVTLWRGLQVPERLPERPVAPRPTLVAVPPPSRLRRADGAGPLVPPPPMAPAPQAPALRAGAEPDDDEVDGSTPTPTQDHLRPRATG